MLRAANVIYTMGNQQAAYALASAALSVFEQYRVRVMQSFDVMASRAAGLSTYLLSEALRRSRESVQDDIQSADATAEDEFGKKIDELQNTGLLLFLISQAQIAAMLRSIQVQGIQIESLYQDMGVTVYRKVYLSSASTLANGGDVRSMINSLTSDRPTPGEYGSILPSVRANLSTMVHGVGTGMMQYVMRANQQLFVGEIHSSIIDDVTCRVCRELNGNYYPLENGVSTARPVPVHRSCRCNLVPIVTIGESTGFEIPKKFDEWLRDNPDVAKELLGSRFKEFVDGKFYVGSFVDYRKQFHIPTQSFEELRSLIWQTSR